MAYLTRDLAEHIHCSLRDGLPADVNEVAMKCLLDLIGAAIAGYDMPGPKAARSIAGTLFGTGAVPVWLSGTTVAPLAALHCNAAAASALDLDDGSRAARGHPGAAVIPTAFAALPQADRSASELIAAVALGYDVGIRIASAQNPEGIKTRQTGRWAAFAAAATAGRLLKSPPHVIAQALSIAGVLAPNQQANGSSGYSLLTGNDVKEGIAWSAATGLAAISLAINGHTGPEDILDHPGYYDASRIRLGLGQRFEIIDTYFKPYACCRYIHPALDAFFEVMGERRIDAAHIRRIEVETFAWALKLGNQLEPDNLVALQYSLPYCLAVAALEGKDALAPVGNTLIGRPDLSRLAGRVSLKVHPDIDGLFPAQTLARVVVETPTATYASNINAPFGDPKRPMRWSDIEGKFNRVTRDRLSRERQKAFIDGVLNLASGDLDGLMLALR
ncbi:MmgE/PrpD family protein [Ensifer sp. 1H6]|uniref:MmgE/PrpD family protein n=1 Tax=Ensifer sp. 1H6 TaxID=1911585 RepID=UPI001FD9B695|nr:MmgE/PrpD family protein [Ensifer sp. 1H6]